VLVFWTWREEQSIWSKIDCEVPAAWQLHDLIFNIEVHLNRLRYVFVSIDFYGPSINAAFFGENIIFEIFGFELLDLIILFKVELDFLRSEVEDTITQS
jgi:hypothetical protein